MPSAASMRSYIDCDLSAQQRGLWFEAQKLKCEQMNRKRNGSTEGMWNQISLTLWFLLSAHWLTQNAAPDNLHYQSNLSLFPFFFSFPSVGFPLLSSFPYSSLLPSLYLCRWAVWPEKGKRAVPVVSVQRRQREETHSGGSRSWTCSRDIQQKHKTEVQIQWRYYMFWGDGGVK